MKYNYLFLLFINSLYLLSSNGYSQEHHSTEHKTHEPFENHFRISPVLSHTYIPKATSEGKRLSLVPSFGFDLEYWFSHKWGLGFHNDLELETFEVEDGNMSTIEREFPFVTTLDVLHNFHKGWVLVLGAGIEFEKHKNLAVIRLGIEYEIEIGNGWDVAPTIFHDVRINSFNTASIGVGFGKRF